MTTTAQGHFDVTMRPAPPELDGAIGRFDLTKAFHGDLEGDGTGVMLSAGDPRAGVAGYVAIEVVHGRLAERTGSFALQQFGTMAGGEQSLRYEIVPGSGSGDLATISGTVRLTIDGDGKHLYELDYEL